MDATETKPLQSNQTLTRPVAGPVQRLVLAIGGTDREYVAQTWAFHLATALHVPVLGLHVATDGAEPPRDVFTYSRQQADKWHVHFRTHTLWGNEVAKLLSDELAPTDLLVMGTRRLARQFHMGSVAAELLRTAPCPVQLVRLPD
jgi:nucleotide-binding universal stress UspA family protein